VTRRRARERRLEVAADTGPHIKLHTAGPGSASQQTLRLLGNWAATTAAEKRDADALSRARAGARHRPR